MEIDYARTKDNSIFFENGLSTSPTAGYVQTEAPRFSPDRPSHPRRSNTGVVPSVPEDVESLRSHRSSWGISRLSGVFFNARTLDQAGNVDLVLRPLSSLSLLDVSKDEPRSPTTNRAPNHSPPQKSQKKRRFRWCTFMLILVILALLGNVAFLDVRVVELIKIINRKTPSSDAVRECLSQFTINAPSNPSAYPCSTCLPILSTMTNNSDAANAAQFCGLRAILESTSASGQTSLSNGRWGKDLRVCTWSGVSCSDSGLVTSL